MIRRGFRPPRESDSDADIAAIDRGAGRTLACLIRGQYGEYPRRFRRKMADLTPDGMVLRPFWSSPSRTRFVIAEPVESAQVRGREPRTDRNVPMTGAYAEGGGLDYAGFTIIRCQTERGILELAVPRPDVRLVLHYLRLRSAGPGQN